MRKIFISIFLISFIFNFVNAEEMKQTKELISNEDDSSKKTLELQERLRKIQERGKKIDEEDKKEKKQIEARKESLNKLEKTVNELNWTLGIKK